MKIKYSVYFDVYNIKKRERKKEKMWQINENKTTAITKISTNTFQTTDYSNICQYYRNIQFSLKVLTTKYQNTSCQNRSNIAKTLTSEFWAAIHVSISGIGQDTADANNIDPKLFCC